jgi:nucleoside-diphosphate-sugar epimerase
MINKNSKILITGGSGLVGQNLTNRLVKEGYTNMIVATDDNVLRFISYYIYII